MSLADSLDVLYEDNHCLALNKPVGWPSAHFDGTEETVDRLAKARKYEEFLVRTLGKGTPTTSGPVSTR